MKLTVFAISVLFAAILPVGWVRGQDPDSVPARGAPDRPIVLNLSGRVIDEITGQPLAGVRISIPGTGQFGVTDSSGTYHLEWGLTLYHPPYPVDATLPGCFPEQLINDWGATRSSFLAQSSRHAGSNSTSG